MILKKPINAKKKTIEFSVLCRQQSESLKKVDQAMKDVEYYRQVHQTSSIRHIWIRIRKF